MNPRVRPAHEMIQEYHRQQLLPGEKPNAMLEQRIYDRIKSFLWYGNLSKNSNLPGNDTAGTLKVSLQELCAQMFIEGLTDAYLGHLIWEIRPDLLKSSLVWERTNWKYLYQLPGFMSKDMLHAKNEIVEAFSHYFKAPKEDRKDSVFFVSAVEQELRECDLSNEEIAQIFMLHHWA